MRSTRSFAVLFSLAICISNSQACEPQKTDIQGFTLGMNQDAIKSIAWRKSTNTQGDTFGCRGNLCQYTFNGAADTDLNIKIFFTSPRTGSVAVKIEHGFTSRLKEEDILQAVESSFCLKPNERRRTVTQPGLPTVIWPPSTVGIQISLVRFGGEGVFSLAVTDLALAQNDKAVTDEAVRKANPSPKF